MRILHVAESVKGGCGTYLNQLVRAQLRDSAISGVRTVLPDAHVLQVPDIPDSARALFTGRARSPMSLHAMWQVTAREIARFQPDCIHLHSTFAGAVGRLGLLIGRKRPPVVYCAHGWSFDMDAPATKRRAMAMIERTLAYGCEGIIAISEHERRRGIAAGIAPERIVTVLNGIVDSPPPAPPRPGAIRRALFIGCLDRQKGFDTLLAATAGLSDRLQLHVIGSSVVGDDAAPKAVPPDVSMLGWCDEARIRQELAWADCVVIPSRWEGFGLVAVEAMRAGRAVIASRVGGLPEVVDEGRTGWLVPPDDPAALRQTLLGVADDDLVRAGTAGRQRFLQRFTIDRTASALTAVYRQAIAMRGSITHAFASHTDEVLA